MAQPTWLRRGVLAALAAAGGARAQGVAPPERWSPNRPLRWIVPYPPGGGSDFIARLIAAALGPRLGQPIVIENRPGAASALGIDLLAKSAPDGLTIGTADNAGLVLNPLLYQRLPYDVARDLRPIGSTVRFHLMLCVRPESGIATAAALIDRARAAPGTIDYGSPGAGLPHHLAMERLARESGVRLNVVHYRGLAGVMNDVIGGTLTAAVLDYAAAGEHVRAGRIRALAICSSQRLAGLPEVPTVTEALGLAGFEAYAWQALIVPAATPEAPVARLRAELRAVLEDPELRARLLAAGLDPLVGGPEDVAARIAAETAVWGPLIRALGITLDL